MITIKEKVSFTKDDVLTIFQAIFGNKERVRLQQGDIYKVFTIKKDNRGIRKVLIGKTLFTEQDPNRTAEFGLTYSAIRAREGHQIMWGIQPGEFIHVEDGKIIKFTH